MVGAMLDGGYWLMIRSEPCKEFKLCRKGKYLTGEAYPNDSHDQCECGYDRFEHYRTMTGIRYSSARFQYPGNVSHWND